MKLYVFAVMLIVCANSLSCSNGPDGLSGNRSVKGVYAMKSEGEFSKAEDTLVIHPLENQTLLFGIVRKVGFQRMAKNGLQPKQIKQEKSLAVWDGKAGQLKEQTHGRVYFLSIDGRQLQSGSIVYQKIADQ